MKRLCVTLLLILLLTGSAWADQLTLVPRGGQLPVCSTAWQLTFADATVLIHGSACRVAGRTLAANVDRTRLYLVRDHRPASERTGYVTLYSDAGFQLAVVNDPALLQSGREVWLQPVRGSRQVTLSLPERRDAPDPVVEEFLGRLTIDTYRKYLTALSDDLTTRYSCTDQVLEARDIIAEEFRQLGLETSQPTFNNPCFACGEPDGFNVVGIKRGTVRPEEYYLVGGHYDSTSPNLCSLAPGSNDNGSGTASVLELARVFAEVDTEASIIFVAFGGEELGLLGSNALVRQMANQGLLNKIQAFLVADMVSYNKNNYAAFYEGSNENQEQIDTLKQIGALTTTYTDLEVSGTYDYWGSDHEPFLNRGLPGALIIEEDWDAYSAYHTTADTLDKQKFPYALDMTKAMAAVLATWAVIVPAADDDADDDDATDDDGTDDDTFDDDSDDDNSFDDDSLPDDDTDADDDDDDDNDSGACGC